MRNAPTEPERRLWSALRASQLGGHKFRRQAVVGNRIADFYCPAKGVIVEVDGDTHDRPADLQRDAALEAQTGLRTVRFTNEEVMCNLDGVLVALLAVLDQREARWGGGSATPSTNPSITLSTTPHPPPLKRRGSEAVIAPSSSEEGVGGGAVPPPTIAETLRQATESLAPISESPRLDAELLMAHALGASRSDVLLRHMRDPSPASFADLVARRLAHEPVAYITGHQEFYGLPLRVSSAVLIPRADSETLIEAARLAFEGRAPRRIIDLGTGSGALLLAALSLWPEAEGVGIDRSPAALQMASANAKALKMAERSRFLDADWTKSGWSEGLGQFDLVLANPPYVEEDADLRPQVRAYEPAGALFAGPDGLDDYRIVIPQIPSLLAPGGVALVEIGYTQDRAVCALAEQAGLSARLHRDLGNRPRALELVSNYNISLGKSRGDH